MSLSCDSTNNIIFHFLRNWMGAFPRWDFHPSFKSSQYMTSIIIVGLVFLKKTSLEAIGASIHYDSDSLCDAYRKPEVCWLWRVGCTVQQFPQVKERTQFHRPVIQMRTIWDRNLSMGSQLLSLRTQHLKCLTLPFRE